MPARTCVIWGPEFTRYDFGDGHPMAPIRIDLTARLCESFGVFDGIEVIDPGVGDDDLLATVHDRDYIAAVRRASEDPEHGADPARGLGTEDVPVFRGMHEASARLAAGTRIAAERVWTGATEHAVNFTGGMHHAMPDRASGFCVYNDVAIGIQWLLDQGVERVAYVDFDVHHGDGVEKIFWDDPRVLTCSVHQNGRTLFPGTGWPGDIGGAGAEGTALNVALPPGTTDSQWLRAIQSTVGQVVRDFAPQVLVTQHGCDSHMDDPLAHLAISVDAQRYAMDVLHRLAHEAAGGRWIAVGGGGYEVVQVVPRSWTHLVAVSRHEPIHVSTPTPQAWRDQVHELTDQDAPTRMGDLPPGEWPIWVQPWEMGYNPHSEVDRAIMATRQSVFPLHGMDPYFG